METPGELNIVKVDDTHIEGVGLKAEDVGCGFLLKPDAGGQRELYLDNVLLEALYNQMKAKGN